MLIINQKIYNYNKYQGWLSIRKNFINKNLQKMVDVKHQLFCIKPLKFRYWTSSKVVLKQIMLLSMLKQLKQVLTNKCELKASSIFFDVLQQMHMMQQLYMIEQLHLIYYMCQVYNTNCFIKSSHWICKFLRPVFISQSNEMASHDWWNTNGQLCNKWT